MVGEDHNEVNLFYEKLNKLNESSGLTLVNDIAFNNGQFSIAKIRSLCSTLLSTWHKARRLSQQSPPHFSNSGRQNQQLRFEELFLIHKGNSPSSSRGQTARILMGNIQDPTENWIVNISTYGQDHIIQGEVNLNTESNKTHQMSLVEAVFTALLLLQKHNFRNIVFVTDGLFSQLWGQNFRFIEESEDWKILLQRFNRDLSLWIFPTSFNFRETILDLYLFYKEVTRRGGFNQVTIDRKWDEVASSLDLKRNDSMLLNQLQKVYQNLLYLYEQTQYYRTPAKTNKRDENVLPHSVVTPDELDRSATKRNENLLPHSVVNPDELDRSATKRNENVLPHSVVNPDELDRSATKRNENVLPHSVVNPDELDRSATKRNENVLPHSVVNPDELDRLATKRNENVLPHSVVSPDELDRIAKKRKRRADTQQQESTGPETPEQKRSNKKPPKGKELKKEHDNPVRPRNSYQFFLKAECDRLKKVLGEKTNFVNLRTMAGDKWKQFSEADKQPYVEASKADRVRYLQEVVTFKLQQEKQEDDTSSSPNYNMLKFCASSSEIEREYHVKFDPETGDLVPPPPVEPLIVESSEEIIERANNESTDPIFCDMNCYEYDFDDLPESYV